MARHLELHTRVSSSPRSSRPSPTTSRYELGGLGSAFGEGIGLGLGRSLSTRSTSSQTQSQTQTQTHLHSPRLPVQQDDYFTRNTLVPAPAHTYTHTHIHTHTHTYTHSHTHANAAGQSPHLVPVAAPDADRLAWHRMRFMTLDDSPLASPGSPPLAGTSGLGSPALGSPALESPMFSHPAHSPSPISPVSPTDEYRAQFGRACMRASMRTSILGPPLKSRSMDVPPDGTGRSAARHLRLSVEPRRMPRTPRGSNESSGRDEETTDSGCSAGEEDGQPPAAVAVGDGLVTPIREHLLPIERTRSPCPAIVSTPPETPRRLTAVPSTPPRSASSRQQYHLPRSPGTPHLGAEIARIQGSPMTRSPGCRSLSSFI